MNQVNKEKESIKEAVNQREALHLQSKEVVKLWSNTIAVSYLHRAIVRFNLLYFLLGLQKLQCHAVKQKVNLVSVFIFFKGSKAKESGGKEDSRSD